ncbi:MAG: nicotianamine synthase [Pseudonocardia sp.]|nr:nicotianamine synthase [Pseudonocardia sp.]
MRPPNEILLAERVIALRHRLEATDLTPGAVVNSAFGELVTICCRTPDATATATLRHVTAHAPAIRAICATGETALEHHWSRRIAAAPDPRAELRRFPYLGNYRDLVRLELGALAALGVPTPRRVVVAGSGPLPLTGLVLAADHGAEVVHVDRDVASRHDGDKVTAALGLGDRVTSLCVDLAEPDPALDAAVARADVVVLAAMVGVDGPGKAAVSARLAAVLRPEARVVVRSANRLRTLLYPAVTPADLPGLTVLLEVHPATDVVNSVLVARPEETPGEVAR